jgi:hypothetical protein
MNPSPRWNPGVLLSLFEEEGEPDWFCVANDSGTGHRCRRRIPEVNVAVINQILPGMALQVPNQIDHVLLLELAQACLCTDAHRGTQEAAIIYRWTSLMSAEASRLCLDGPSLPADTCPDAAMASASTSTLPPPDSLTLGQPNLQPHRQRRRRGAKGLTIKLTKDDEETPKRPELVSFATPTAMDFSQTREWIQSIECEDHSEPSTLLASPLPNNGQDNTKSSNKSSNTAPPLFLHVEPCGPKQPGQAQQRGTTANFPPSPPDSATSLLPPSHSWSPTTTGAAPSSSSSPQDDQRSAFPLRPTSLRSESINNTRVSLAQSPSPSPSPIIGDQGAQHRDQKLGSSVLSDDYANQTRSLVLSDHHITQPQAEITLLRQQQEDIQRTMMLLIWVMQGLMCFPLAVLGLCELGLDVAFRHREWVSVSYGKGHRLEAAQGSYLNRDARGREVDDPSPDTRWDVASDYTAE